MKKILGLDLGTTSIGWALVNEAEMENEKSEIIKTGVRIVPITTDEENDFQKGKSVSINADRRSKRSARRNLHRYKLRRKNLIEVLKNNNIINDNSILAETGEKSTHSLLKLRSEAAQKEVSLEDFARILLAINKKRGYKSNRKTKSSEEGESIDSIDTAKHLYDNNLTPGQYVLKLLNEGKKNIPEFYRSDLHNELDLIWNCQKHYYPDILTQELKESLINKNKGQTWKILEKPFNISGIKRQGNKQEQKLENYQWRVKGLQDKLDLEILAIVLQEINGEINKSSGYLGEISDRSKILYLTKQTVGQYLYNQIKENPHQSIKNQVFYRQDYMDEFEKIWEIQSKNRKNILTDKLKAEIRDIVIFYQRRLKSQKGLISICEFEGIEKEIIVDGNKKTKIIGPRVIPKFSPLFQEFKIWQIINNLKFLNTETNEIKEISDIDSDISIRKQIFNELNIKGKLKSNEVVKKIFKKPKNWKITNYDEIEGNNTNYALYRAYEKIAEISGHEIDKNKIVESISEIFKILGINTEILYFNSDLKGKELEEQPAYKLWHLLYSFEEDNSKTGHENLFVHLKENFGFEKEYAKV